VRKKKALHHPTTPGEAIGWPIGVKQMELTGLFIREGWKRGKIGSYRHHHYHPSVRVDFPDDQSQWVRLEQTDWNN
jgi:hypothetical protein